MYVFTIFLTITDFKSRFTLYKLSLLAVPAQDQTVDTQSLDSTAGTMKQFDTRLLTGDISYCQKGYFTEEKPSSF